MLGAVLAAPTKMVESLERPLPMRENGRFSLVVGERERVRERDDMEEREWRR